MSRNCSAQATTASPRAGLYSAPFSSSFCLRYDVGAVQGVVQTAPACVGRVQGIAGVVYRHHQLRARHACDFRIHVGSGDRIVVGFRLQIADFLKELPLFIGREALAAPLIDSLLKIVPLFEECSIQGGQIPNDGSQGSPERVRVDAGSGCNLVLDQVKQPFVDAKTAAGDATEHGGQGSLCADVQGTGLTSLVWRPGTQHIGRCRQRGLGGSRWESSIEAGVPGRRPANLTFDPHPSC